jgi:hypothetical protein
MANSGVINLQEYIIAYEERNVYIYFDVPADAKTERSIITVEPFIREITTRYVYQEWIAYLYVNRWVTQNYVPIIVSDKYIYQKSYLRQFSDRYITYYQDTGYRYVFCEGLITQTPLLLKYPKYYDWTYVPPVISPTFQIWSFYPIDNSNITIFITTDKNRNFYIHSGNNFNAFKIKQLSDKIYEITVSVDAVFDYGEKITCQLSLYDIKGNYLKPGIW